MNRVVSLAQRWSMFVGLIHATYRLVVRSLVIASACAAGGVTSMADARENLDSDGKQVLRPFAEYRRWGYVNRHGQVAIAPQFAWASDFVEGRARVYGSDGGGYIRPDGSLAVALPDGAVPIGHFAQSRAWFRRDRRFGCVDRDGNIVIPAIYQHARSFSEGLAAVADMGSSKKGGDPDSSSVRWGYIDRAGNISISLQFEGAGDFRDGLARIRRTGRTDYEYIDKEAKVALTLRNLIERPQKYVSAALDFSDGLAAVFFDGYGTDLPCAGFVDHQGRLSHGRKYQTVRSFSEGLAAVTLDSRVGYVTVDGRIVIAPEFDEGGDFHEGHCRVRFGNFWHYIDREGRMTAIGSSGAQWNDAEDFYGGLARVHIDGTFSQTPDGPAWWQGGKWLYIDGMGKTIAICRWDTESPPSVFLGKEYGGSEY